MANTHYPQILSTGITVTSSNTAQTGTIPVNASGTYPRFVMVAAITNPVSLKFGQSGVTATNNDLVITVNRPLTLNVTGCSNFSYLSFTAGSSGILNITPLEQ